MGRGGQADRTPAIRGKRQLEAGRVAVSQAGKLLVTSQDELEEPVAPSSPGV